MPWSTSNRQKQAGNQDFYRMIDATVVISLHFSLRVSLKSLEFKIITEPVYRAVKTWSLSDFPESD